MPDPFDASKVDLLGNEIEYKAELFSSFKSVDGRNYVPLTKEAASSIPGKYRRRSLNTDHELLKAWRELELKQDGTVIPSAEILGWKYHGSNILLLYSPYPAMPEYGVEAGIEEEAYYVFVETNGKSLILSNRDGSLTQIYEKSEPGR